MKRPSCQAAASSGGASQPTVTAASSGASLLTEEVNASRLDLTQVWARIHKFGRFPKRIAHPETEAQKEENALFNFLYNVKKLGIPDEIWD